MGDISRHRDVFLFTRSKVSTQLLDGARLAPGDLTYLELGNYLTDVSQFRDPVTYIFAKQRVWRDKVIPKTSDKLMAARLMLLAGAVAAYGVSKGLDELLSGDSGDYAEGAALAVAALAGLAAILPSDTYAGLAGADTWIDTLLGVPLDLTKPAAMPATAATRAKRDEKHYGYLGEFFRLFIEGTTHFIFADDVTRRADGEWGSIAPIPPSRVTDIYAEFFTQYFPHEHTDQPPYIWDASKRPSRPSLYGPSRADGGVMNAVDRLYVDYLAEGFDKVLADWRALKRDDRAGRQALLVRMGKLLHGVEDWFFHSNVVELLELRTYRPRQGDSEDDEAFLARFVDWVVKHRPEYVATSDPAELRRLTRKLYRRLRFPAYESGTRTQSGGRLSTTRMSTPSLKHAYPAFPSSQDTAHTLLHALENLEHKAAGEPGKLPAWITSVLEQRGLGALEPLAELAKPFVMAPVESRLREWVPLVFTLLSEDERRRLVANVAPEHWPLAPGAAHPPRTVEETETDLQAKRHAAALKPHAATGGRTESNYEEFVRLLFERGHLNARGQQALVAAFAIDRKSEELPTDAPGCGGFLMQFAIELQEQLDKGDAATDELNKDERSVKGRASDNGAFNEIVGSHSLMSKDTTKSVPFFDDARVLASVASSSLLTIMLQQVAAPVTDRRLAWDQILHGLLRFPPSSEGWERLALAKFRPKGEIPGFSDLPELAALVERSMQPSPPRASKAEKSKRESLEELYVRLETALSQYRYP